MSGLVESVCFASGQNQLTQRLLICQHGHMLLKIVLIISHQCHCCGMLYSNPFKCAMYILCKCTSILQGAVCSVSAGELESLLSHIRDLLPDLGEGFILACLEEYGYNTELVINNILEDHLTPALDKLDRAMPR